MLEKEVHIVPNLEKHIRLSDYILEEQIFINYTSRQGIKKAIKRGNILLDGKKAETGIFVKAEQKITVIEDETNESASFDLDLTILYEDDDLAIIRKPAGISVSGNTKKNIANALKNNLKPSSKADALFQAKPTHRLDKGTSGLLLVAKTNASCILLNEFFSTKKIQKTYYAVVEGQIKESGTINSPIENKESISFYEPVKNFLSRNGDTFTFVKLQPKTGRTHQLRIHLSELGHPILGDGEYGSRFKKKGLYLFAAELSFAHPISGVSVHITDELPNKFSKLFQYYFIQDMA